MKKCIRSIIAAVLLLTGFKEVNAQAGAALNFGASNNNYVAVGGGATYDNLGLGNFTLEAWINLNTLDDGSNGGINSIFRKTGDYDLYVDNGMLCAEIWPNGTSDPTWLQFRSTTFISINTWTHVAFTWNKASNTGTLYVNGVAQVGSITTGSIFGSEPLWLGLSSIYGQSFDGAMDEVRIFDYQLSQCQIQASKNCEFSGPQAGLKLYYQFNEGIAGGSNAGYITAPDISGTGGNGGLYNFALSGTSSNWVAPGGVTSGVSCGAVLGPTTANTATINVGGSASLTASGASTYTWSTGATAASIVVSPTVTTVYTVTASGNGCTGAPITTTVYVSAAALNFNGSNNYISVPNNALLNFGTNDFTIEADFKSTASQPNYAGLVAKCGFSSSVGWQLELVNNRIAAEFSDGTTFWGSANGLLGTTTLNDGNWHRLAMVVSRSSGNISLYVDGIVEASVTSASISTMNISNTSVPMLIGTERTYADYINGNIDEVRIWNRALCGSEILNNMNAELKVSGQTGLVAYYPLNEGFFGSANSTVTTAVDSSGNFINGALTNFTLSGTTSNWIYPGAVNTGSYAASFNGSGTTITVATATTSICSGASTTFTASGSSYYAWSPPASLSSSTSAIVTASPTSTTVYSVSTGCIGAPTTTLTLTVKSLPTPTIGGITTVCSGGGTTTLTVSDAASTGGPYSYSWSDGSTASTSNSISTAGTYSVVLTNGNGCSASASQVVTSNPIAVTSTGGISLACYASLFDAFTAINNGTHTGTISVSINGSTSEISNCVLNASGSGSASYSSITMQPSGTYTIQYSSAGNALITLNGAKNVTIDGINAGGKALTLTNIISSTTIGTGTILFVNDASNNIITNCTILSNQIVAVGSLGGNIMFSTTTGTTGNDNNTISYCNIGSQTPATNSLSKAIYMGGSSNSDPGTANSGNIIDHNNIYDYFRSSANNAGIDVNSGTVSTTISNNRFYLTLTKSFASANLFHRAISINNISGNAFQITGNIIGYATSAGTGTYNVVFNSSSTSAQFVGIYLNVANTTATSVQSNTITSIAITGASSGTSANAPFKGIYAVAGSNNIGNITGNTIGSMSSTGDISYTSTNATASDIYGILNTSGVSANISNNNIGGFLVTKSTLTNACNFYGIRSISGSIHTWTCNNNTIGGNVSNSIQSQTNSVATLVYGIINANATGKISNNTIRNLTSGGGSLYGINVNNSTQDTISQNTISGLTSGGSAVYGINFNGTGTGSLIERNLIYGLSGSNSNYGISISNGTSTYQNNMIAINVGTVTAGADGIFESGGTNKIWYNSIYISGAPTSSSTNTHSFYSTVTGNTRLYVNNIFVNTTSNNGSSGTNYIIGVGGTSSNPAGLTMSGNLYYGTGAGNVFGYFNSTNVTTFASWQTTVGQDATSVTGDPLFIAPTITPPNLRINTTGAVSPADQAGVNVNVANDFDGQIRSSLTPYDIGANAFIACSTPTITVSATNTVICSGSTTTLTASGAGTYTWSSGELTSSINPSPTVTTTYTVTGALASCSLTATAIITITANPSPTISVNSGAICNGQSFTMTPSGANTYTFSSGSAVVSPTTTASYSVTGTSAAGCVSSNTAVSTITVNPLPTISVNSGTICDGQSFTMTPSGANTYTFSSGSAVVGPTTTASYSVTGTSSAGCISSNTAVSTVTVNPLPTISVNSGAICKGQSFTMTPSGANTYTFSSGSAVVSPTTTTSYSVTGTSAAGCLSSNTAVSTVTVNPLPTVSVNTATICTGATATLTANGANTYTWNTTATGASITPSPTITAGYTVSGTDANNCTNQATTTVTVNSLPTYSLSGNVFTICNGGSQTFTVSGANTYTWTPATTLTGANTANPTASPTTTAVYSVTGTNGNGCTNPAPATVTVNVNAAPALSLTASAYSICIGGSQTFSVSGASTYTWTPATTLTGANTANPTANPTTTTVYTVNGTASGCAPSPAKTVTLTVNPLPTISVNSATLCAGATAILTASGASTYTWNTNATGASITPSPTITSNYSVTGTDVNNCQNTATATITVNNPSASSLNINGCSSVTVNATTYTASGTYVQHLTNAAGCDSSITINAVVNLPTTSTVSATGCNSVTVNAATYTASGTYVQHTTNSSGCDSAITVNVAINLPTTSTVNITGCGSVIVNATTYTASGTYMQHLTNAAGCDSAITINAVIKNAVTFTQSPVICNGQSVTVGVNTYTASGTYTDVLTASNGCDSTVTTNLTVRNAITYTQSPSVCNGQSFTVGANTYTTSGTYTDVLTSANGCDSTVITSLTVSNVISFTQNPIICAGQSFTVGTSVYNTTGTYTNTFTAAAGCDSIVTTNLTVRNAITYTQSPVVCNGQSFIVGVNTYTATGTYTDVLTTINGCDSTVTTNLTVSNSISTNQSFTLCAGQSVTVGTSTYTTQGTYTDTLTANAGCDSVVTTQLMVNALPIVSVNSPTICAGQTATLTATGANSYAWSTSQTGSSISVTPTVTATYTVTGTDMNNCADTAVATVDVNCTTQMDQMINNNEITVYPNPSTEIFYLQTNTVFENASLEVYDITGRKVFAEPIKEKITPISSSNMVNGIYQLRIISNNTVIYQGRMVRTN